MTKIRTSTGNFSDMQKVQNSGTKYKASCSTICQPYSAPTPTPCGTKCMLYCAGK